MSSFSLRLLFQGLPTCNKMHRCLWMCFMSLYFHHFWLWVFSLPAASGSLFPWLSSGCLSVHGKLFALGMLCFRIGKLLHFVHEDWLVSKHSYQHRLPPCCTVSALKKTEYRTKQTMNKLTKCHPWQILKTQSTWCTWVKKKTKCYELHYMADWDIPYFETVSIWRNITCIPTCTEWLYRKKKEQNNIPAKRKITSNFPLCCYSNLKTRKCKNIYLLLIK